MFEIKKKTRFDKISTISCRFLKGAARFYKGFDKVLKSSRNLRKKALTIFYRVSKIMNMFHKDPEGCPGTFVTESSIMFCKVL